MSLASGVSLPHVPFTETAEDRYSGSLYPHPIIMWTPLSVPCSAEIPCGCCPRRELLGGLADLVLLAQYFSNSALFSCNFCYVRGAPAHFCQPYIILLCLLCYLNRFKMVTCGFNFLSDKVFVLSAVFRVSSCWTSCLYLWRWLCGLFICTNQLFLCVFLKSVLDITNMVLLYSYWQFVCKVRVPWIPSLPPVPAWCSGSRTVPACLLGQKFLI